MPFFPKEHGAYGQLSFPLVTSLIVSGVSAGSALFALAIVAGFLAHEPLLVVLGLRGPRARRELGRTAIWWLASVTAVLVVCGALAMRWMTPEHRISVMLPLVPALYLFWAAVSGHGKSTAAELAVAIAFSTAAIPLCLLGGSPATTGVVVALAFATNFVLATLAVRVVIVKVRGGGDPRQVAAMRRAVFVLAAAIAAAVIVAAVLGLLPPAPLVSVAPGIIVALWIAASPPPPSKLRKVGWTLVGTSGAIAVLLIATLWAVQRG